MNAIPESTGNPRVPLLPILSVNFIGALGFSIVLPFLVFLVTRWGGNALIYGIVGATYSAFQLVGAPILGRWSDRFGRRRILLLSQLGTFLSWVLFLAAFALPLEPRWEVTSGPMGGFALTLPLLAIFVARAADGLTGGNVSVANAYLADITSEEQRAANFGKMAVAANLGFILGPAIAGLLGSSAAGELLPVLAAAFISLVATAIIAFRLPESRPCVLEKVPEKPGTRKIFGQEQKPCVTLTKQLPARQILGLPGIRALLAVHFLVILGFNFFYVAFPVHAVQALNWSVTEVGVFFTVLGLQLVVVEGPVLARVSRKLPDGAIVTGGGLLLAASFACFVAPSRPVIYVGVTLLALGNGLMWPSVMSLISRAAGDEYQGSVQGFAASSGAVASIIGLIVGGSLYGQIQGQVFWLATIVIAAASLISLARARAPSRR